MSCCRFQSTVSSHQRCCLSLGGWDQGQHPVQGGRIFLSQSAEPAGSSTVVVLDSLHHAHPGLGHCISGLLAKHLPQMSARRLIITWSRIIATGVGVTGETQYKLTTNPGPFPVPSGVKQGAAESFHLTFS